MKLLYTIIVTLVLLFVISFSLENTEPIHLSYYGLFDLTLASYLLIFVSFGVGVIFAGLFGIVERWRLSRKVTKLTRNIKNLEKSMPHPETEELQAIQKTEDNEVSDRS